MEEIPAFRVSSVWLERTKKPRGSPPQGLSVRNLTTWKTLLHNVFSRFGWKSYSENIYPAIILIYRAKKLTWWLHLSKDPVASTKTTSPLCWTSWCVLLISWSHTATTTTPFANCLMEAIFSPALELTFSISSQAFTKLSGPLAEPNLPTYFVHMSKTVPLPGLIDLLADSLKNSASPSFSFSSAT